MPEGLNHLGIGIGPGKAYAHKSANVEAECLRLDEKSGAGDDAHLLHFTDALVDGCAGYAAFAGDFKEREPCVFDEE